MNYLFIKELLKTNMRASMALKGAFVLNAFFMVINNLAFFTVWWVFFTQFKNINGWGLAEVSAMYGITAFSFGIAVILAGGARDLSKMVVDGELDSYLVQPKDVLLHILGSKSQMSGWGDLVSGFFLIAVSGYLTWANAIPLIILNFSAAAVFLSFRIIVHSLSFWLGPMENLSRQLSEFIITFSAYPQTLFNTYFKVFLFTIIPAGFIGYLPVKYLMEKNIFLLLGAFLAGVFYLLLARIIFMQGLKRYESGNKIL
ncbi:MAG: hypothetical protein A2X86_08895 [Bdellovibrionales bacterium GWA2_49_15]|nr:MAG: hypothetical protein A2X86_08895 [Bdellovibrionales bacterium GWA2_49_15]HAZ12894.1 hypothetical protein [Bdellovibrionales bacterium]